MANGGGPNWNTALNSSLPCKGKEKRGGEKEGGEKEGREDGEERKKKEGGECIRATIAAFLYPPLTCKCVFIPEPSKSLNALYCINLRKKRDDFWWQVQRENKCSYHV